MKKNVIISSGILLGLLLGGSVTSNQQVFAKSDTKLQLNIPDGKNAVANTDDDNSIQFKANDDGTFIVTGKTNPNAKVTIERQSDFKDYTVKANSNGSFSKNVKLSKKAKAPKYDISAKAKGRDDSSTITFKVNNVTKSKQEASSSSSNSNSSSDSSSSASPDIRTQFDVNHMSKYSNEDLAKDVTLKDFYVKDVNKSKLGDYHYLLTPSSTSKSYFMLVQDKKIKNAKPGSIITIDGYLNGKGNVNMGDKSSPYQGKDCILVMTE